MKCYWSAASAANGCRTAPLRGLPPTRRGTRGPTLPGARYLHAAELLEDGRVLIAGGLGQEADGPLFALASAAVYDPRADTWTEVAPLRRARAELTLTRLEDGSVLAVGGYDDDMLASAELFDPATGTWTSVGPMPHACAGHTATALADGRALVIGGTGGSLDQPSPAPGESILYSPRTRSFEVGAPLAPRTGHTATRLKRRPYPRRRRRTADGGDLHGVAGRHRLHLG